MLAPSQRNGGGAMTVTQICILALGNLQRGRGCNIATLAGTGDGRGREAIDLALLLLIFGRSAGTFSFLMAS